MNLWLVLLALAAVTFLSLAYVEQYVDGLTARTLNVVGRVKRLSGVGVACFGLLLIVSIANITL